MKLNQITRQKLNQIGMKHRMMRVMDTMIEIWKQDSKAMRKLEAQNKLIPAIENLIPNLQIAHNLKLDHPHLSEMEVFQMSGVPMFPPRS